MELMGCCHGRNAEATLRSRFQSYFRIDAEMCEVVWEKVIKSGWTRFAGRKPRRVHLLWTLLFLNTYNTE